MKALLIFVTLGFAQVSWAANQSESLTPPSTQNCVNPGGGCDGSVPCCDPNVNACFNGRCVPFKKSFLQSLFGAKGVNEVVPEGQR